MNRDPLFWTLAVAVTAATTGAFLCALTALWIPWGVLLVVSLFLASRFGHYLGGEEWKI